MADVNRRVRNYLSHSENLFILIFKAYILILCCTFFCSLLSFRCKDFTHLKLFSLLIGIGVLTEILAAYGPAIFRIESNYPFYDVYLLIQYIVYGVYFKHVLPSGTIRNSIFPYLSGLAIFWCYTSFSLFKFMAWNSYIIIAGDLFTVLYCCYYFYSSFTSERQLDFSRSPEFWIAAGLFIYSCCELPITGILNYIASHYPDLTMELFTVLQVLNILMYSIFMYAFLCTLKTHTTN